MAEVSLSDQCIPYPKSPFSRLSEVSFQSLIRSLFSVAYLQKDRDGFKSKESKTD